MKTKIYYIDLFCGAGGTSTGIDLADSNAEVIACVNHDLNAIKSHEANHPNALHFTEDIRTLELSPIVDLVQKLRAKEECIISLWASLECTNYSKAKGGLPKDADSRTLANHLFRYIEAINPDYIWIENVREFMSWGPLNDKGRPLSMKKGRDYMTWKYHIEQYGYRYDSRLLNSANYGAYTSRLRYFAQFAKDELPIIWPEPTHSENPNKENDLFEKPLKKWKAVKDVLDLKDEGNSIFNRKKPLVENTLKRIYAGLVKFVANGDDSFLQKYYSGRPKGKVISIEGPAGTVKTVDGHSLILCDFILKYNSLNQKGNYVPPSVDDPCPTVAAQNRIGKVKLCYLQSYYKNSSLRNLDVPAQTITTKDRLAKVNFMMLNYSNGSNLRSIESPAGTIMKNDKHNLMKVELTDYFLYNPQYKNKGNSIENPSPVIIARQDKKPLGLVAINQSDLVGIPVFKDDCETMVKIKIFMAHYGIYDIKMRMLKVEELLQIQGFPKDYHLAGNQTEQKKYIGNAVEVNMAKALINANAKALQKLEVA